MKTTSRSAFSILEVMIAITILAVVMAATAASMGSLVGLRRYSADTAEILVLSKGLLERFAGADPAMLGDASLPWSVSCYKDTGIDSGSPFGVAINSSDCIAYGLSTKPPVYGDLKIYIEYYLAEQQIDANSLGIGPMGIYDDPAGPFAGIAADQGYLAFQKLFADTSAGANFRKNYWIKPGANGRISDVVQTNTPILIRVLFTRTSDPAYRQQFITGVRL